MSKRGVSPAELVIPQSVAYECTFLVWRNAPGLEAKNHPGHSTLLLRRNLNAGHWYTNKVKNTDTFINYPDYISSNERYISFWPGSEKDTRAIFLEHHLKDYYAELGDAASELLINIDNHHVPAAGQPARTDRVWRNYQQTGTWPVARPGQVVIGDHDKNDLWGRKYDAALSVQGLCNARPYELGINLNEVVEWAINFKSQPECSYYAVSTTNNCAGVAVGGLVAGGADAFSCLWGSPSKGTVYITPNDAETYVESVKIGIQRTNMMLGYFRQVTANVAVMKDLVKDLYLADAWKAASAVDWKIRGQKLRAIDNALQRYHNLTWGAHFAAKLVELVTIIKNAYDHMLATKSHSRDNAFFILAMQILSVVRQLTKEAADPWPAESYYGETVGRPRKNAKQSADDDDD